MPMTLEERMELFRNTFAPSKDDSVLFIVDNPRKSSEDTLDWQIRRDIMVPHWMEAMEAIGVSKVSRVDFPSTQVSNKGIPDDIIARAKDNTLLLSMTQYSSTSSIIPLCYQSDTRRGASMPGITIEMEDSALRGEYGKGKEIHRITGLLESYLKRTEIAIARFDSGHDLIVDLRYRQAHPDQGSCTEPGDAINLPSGECLKVPYEGTPEDIKEFGEESRTQGCLPLVWDGHIVVACVEKNRMVSFECDTSERAAKRAEEFYLGNKNYSNIAEFALGANRKATLSGNCLEDEKIPGLHIGIGRSNHFPGGRVFAEYHGDSVYCQGRPVTVDTLALKMTGRNIWTVPISQGHPDYMSGELSRMAKELPDIGR